MKANIITGSIKMKAKLTVMICKPLSGSNLRLPIVEILN
jgi:hypothetical protein